MKRIILILLLLSSSLIYPASIVKSLFTFHIRPGTFRGGYVVSDRSILHRGARFFGKISGSTVFRFSGYYMIRFRFFKPVTPIAAKTDGGNTSMRIDMKRSFNVPSADKDFVNTGKGKIFDIFTQNKPTYVKLIVSGKGIKRKISKTKYYNKFRRRTRRAESSSQIAYLFKASFLKKESHLLKRFFEKSRVFVKYYTKRKRIFNHIDGSTAFSMFSKEMLLASKKDINSSFSHLRITFLFKDQTRSIWTFEKSFSKWQARMYKKIDFVIPGRRKRYRY
ncbi:MAG: hypothetical protein KAS64_09855 [Spirochaetes bacterium]|nr:hypothetical protein [Spirochaetota bacterium]